MSENYIWYIEPFGCLMTNRLLSERLSVEDTCSNKLCSDGKERNLWRCEYTLVAELEQAKSQLNLAFRVYVQEGHNTQIRMWPFRRKRT